MFLKKRVSFDLCFIRMFLFKSWVSGFRGFSEVLWVTRGKSLVHSAG